MTIVLLMALENAFRMIHRWIRSSEMETSCWPFLSNQQPLNSVKCVQDGNLCHPVYAFNIVYPTILYNLGLHWLEQCKRRRDNILQYKIGIKLPWPDSDGFYGHGIFRQIKCRKVSLERTIYE